MAALCMVSAGKASACVVLVGLVLIAREGIKLGQNQTHAQMIVEEALPPVVTASLECAYLISVTATLDSEGQDVMKLCL